MTASAPHTPPYLADEIRTALDQTLATGVAYWSTFTTGAFLAPLGGAWSPAENVRHLTKSIRAVTRGLNVPRLVLWFTYRTARHPSRSFEEVRSTYLAHLARGATAGPFAPSPRPAPDDPEAERLRIMAEHGTAVREMNAAIGRWSERALDRRQLPHPLLGRLTVREMLLFTLYHNEHHVAVVRRRVSALS